MIRTQIQLTEEQSDRLHHEARRSGLSTAELIRQSVDQFLDQRAALGAAVTSRMSALEVVGRFCSGLTDVADRHDDYLVEDYLSSTKP